MLKIPVAKHTLSFLCGLSLLLAACSEPTYTPKPRAFPKVEFPERTYQQFDEDYCEFTFQYPTYAEVQQDTSFFDQEPAHPCWFDLYLPAFNSRLYFTYSPIGKEKTLDKLKDETFELADWHNKRATYIDELRIQKENGVSGFAFDIQGPAASPFQFYLTDSTEHFLRAALYFNNQVRPDSMAPIYNFVKEDILKLIETFEWKSKKSS